MCARENLRSIGTLLHSFLSAFRWSLHQKLFQVTFDVFRESVKHGNVSHAGQVVGALEAGAVIKMVAFANSREPSQGSDTNAVENDALMTLATRTLAGSGHFGNEWRYDGFGAIAKSIVELGLAKLFWPEAL